MSKAYEVMTQRIATCEPDTSITEVATIMRDRDIGNVLIVENGKLRGIVTDRDLALRGLTNGYDPLQTPIKKLMSKKVVTGHADWNMERVAKVMADHEVRRLPIVRDGQLVGIVSLGDVALHTGKKDVVTNSLKAVSKPRGIFVRRRFDVGRALLGLTLTAFAATMLAYFTWTPEGQALRKQITRSELMDTARKAMSAASDKVSEAASSKQVRELRHQVRSRSIPLISAVRLPF
jgi:CBS domain-containing protein